MRALLVLLLLAATAAQAQFDLQDSHTTASLRGIHSLGGGVAWASGTNGTILRTEDGGAHWQNCTIPPGAEKLDFRGIQAFDTRIAIVMSSGTGDLSRLYKTTDGCRTWKLVFTNPDPEGFWDTVQFSGKSGLLSGLVAGDPVNGSFPLWWIVPEYQTPANFKETPKAHPGEAAFAASNSALFVYGESFWLATGGAGGAHVIRKVVHIPFGGTTYPSSDVPVGKRTQSSGIFSIGFAPNSVHPASPTRGVAVGGDYLKPEDSTRTAAFTHNGGRSWEASQTDPHGYRSAVAYDATTKTWITVGPNGTDISTDDGKNWQPLKPGPQDQPDADTHWNALSLPFVVGPKGGIGKLRFDALSPQTKPSK